MSNNLSVMIKPASGKCNANCKYCFYRDEIASRSIKDYGNLSIEIANILIDKMLDYVGSGNLSIVFQGGEPTLSGYDFFKFFFESLKEKNTQGANVFLSLQTNGLLVDKKWAKLFKEYNVLVGISLDGDKKSNAERVSKGVSMQAKILDCARILKEEEVEFNVLSVIHKKNSGHGKSIYEYFVSKGFRNLQFIPYLGDSEEYMLSSEEYARFLIDVYTLYARDFHSPTPTRIRQFDNYLMLLKTGKAEQCGMNGVCEKSLIFEGDGTAFPCDFYCTDDYTLGNIKTHSIEELLYSPIATSFRATNGQKEECKTCPYFKLCRGGCKRYTENEEFCEAYKTFFSKTFN